MAYTVKKEIGLATDNDMGEIRGTKRQDHIKTVLEY